MAETSTPDEVRAKIVAAMPAPLGQVYYELSNQVTWVHLKWKDFRELYAKAPRRSISSMPQHLPFSTTYSR